MLRGATPATVPELLDDLHARYGQHPVLLLVDDPVADATLGPALVVAGCVRGAAETFLAHVGPIPSTAAVPDMAVEAVDERNLADWVETKLKGFASSEAEPDEGEVRRGMELRRAEMAGEGRFFLARVGGAPAAILGLYDGQDCLIFLLSTRVPFRGRGIAKSLLRGALSDGYTKGCRSVLINADPAGWASRMRCIGAAATAWLSRTIPGRRYATRWGSSPPVPL